MEPTAEQQPVQNLQPLLGEIVSLGMYMPIEDLLEDYSYEVVIVDLWFGDIYVVIDNCIIDAFNIIRLPPSYHESFTQFLAVIKSNNVQTCTLNIWAVQRKDTPFLGHMAAGLADICTDNPLACMCVYMYIYNNCIQFIYSHVFICITAPDPNCK